MGAPRDRIRVIPRREFTDRLLADLHAFSYRILPEELAHFRVHAETNEVVHVFEHGGRSSATSSGAPHRWTCPAPGPSWAGSFASSPSTADARCTSARGCGSSSAASCGHPRHALLPAGGGEPVRIRLHHLGARRVPDPRPATSSRRRRGRGDPHRVRAVHRGERLPTGPTDGAGVRRHRDLYRRRCASSPRATSNDRRPVPTRGSIPAGGRIAATWRSGSGSRPGTSSPLLRKIPPRPAPVEPEARGPLTRAGRCAGPRRARVRTATVSRPARATARRRGAATWPLSQRTSSSSSDTRRRSWGSFAGRAARYSRSARIVGLSPIRQPMAAVKRRAEAPTNIVPR